MKAWSVLYKVLFLSALALGAGVAGLAVGAPATPPSKPGTAFNPAVRVYLGPTLVNAPFLVAIRKGYLEDEGLKPEIQLVLAGPAVSIQLLSGNRIDVTTINPSSGTNNAILRGASLVALASGPIIPRDRPTAGLMISDKLWQEGVRSIRDLRGRTIHIFPSIDSTSGRVVALLLAREGLDYRKDIQLQAWTDFSKLQQAFATGVIDNFYATEPVATIVRLQHNARFFGSSTDVIPGSAGLLVFASRDFVSANPETTIRVLKAYLRGVRYFNEAVKSGWSRNADVLDVLARETRVKPELLRQIGWNDFAEDGLIDLDDLRATLQFFKDLGTTPEVVPVERWVDQSFVREAYRRLRK